MCLESIRDNLGGDNEEVLLRTGNGSCQAQFWFQCCRTVNNFLLTTHFLCRPSLSKSKKGHSDRACVLSKMHNLKQFLKTWIGFLERVSQFYSVFFHQSVILTPIFMTTRRCSTHFSCCGLWYKGKSARRLSGLSATVDKSSQRREVPTSRLSLRCQRTAKGNMGPLFSGRGLRKRWTNLVWPPFS